MIFVDREDEPNSLLTHKTVWLKNYLTARNKFALTPNKKNKNAVLKAENKYRKSDVKAQLKNMFEGKCAYCESFLAHISYGHIEHFRPKSSYPNDCFEWQNLLLGCEICNGPSYKSIHFPLEDEDGPLVNPTMENPFEFFDFEYDPETGLANVLGKEGRGKKTEILLGLNRPDLIKHRSKIVRRILYVIIKASHGDLDAENEVRKLILKDEEYSAFSISLAKKFGLIL